VTDETSGCLDACVPERTDAYFNRTRAVVERFGDARVTYAVFLRRPVISAPRLMVEWLQAVAESRGTAFDIDLVHPEGTWVGAGDPILYLVGLVPPDRGFGDAVSPENRPALRRRAQRLPDVPRAAPGRFPGHGRAPLRRLRNAGHDGLRGQRRRNAARREGAKGFIGNATDATAHWFGAPAGYGTMPHALIGYARSTLRAAEMFHETYPDQDLTVLVDYFGREITDGLEVCSRFPDLAAAGRLAVRLDTHGGRFLEGLDPGESYAALERHVPGAIRHYRNEAELRYLVGTGVSAAAIWRMREALDDAGFEPVRIVVSSGFGVDKCRVMADAKAPINTVGTGSFIPDRWSETYATADIVAYDGEARVKVGREFLLRPNGQRRRNGGDGPA
jgi:nicotinate phosphoribosyltransferase